MFGADVTRAEKRGGVQDPARRTQREGGEREVERGRRRERRRTKGRRREKSWKRMKNRELASKEFLGVSQGEADRSAGGDVWKAREGEKAKGVDE